MYYAKLGESLGASKAYLDGDPIQIGGARLQGRCPFGLFRQICASQTHSKSQGGVCSICPEPLQARRAVFFLQYIVKFSSIFFQKHNFSENFVFFGKISLSKIKKSSKLQKWCPSSEEQNRFRARKKVYIGPERKKTLMHCHSSLGRLTDTDTTMSKCSHNWLAVGCYYYYVV